MVWRPTVSVAPGPSAAAASDICHFAVHGTTLLPPLGCTAETLSSGGKGCSAAILQQVRNRRGDALHALLTRLAGLDQQLPQGAGEDLPQGHRPVSVCAPTAQSTSLTASPRQHNGVLHPHRRDCDPAVRPEPLLRARRKRAVPAAGHLRPSGRAYMSWRRVCSPADLGVLQIADHLSMLATPAAYSIVLNAFTSADGRADLSKFNKADWCVAMSGCGTHWPRSSLLSVSQLQLCVQQHQLRRRRAGPPVRREPARRRGHVGRRVRQARAAAEAMCVRALSHLSMSANPCADRRLRRRRCDQVRLDSRFRFPLLDLPLAHAERSLLPAFVYCCVARLGSAAPLLSSTSPSLLLVCSLMGRE